MSESGREYSTKIRRIAMGAHGPVYDPAQVWAVLRANSDRNGIIQYNITKLAEAMEVGRQNLSYFVSNFKKMGLIEEAGGHKLRILVKDVTWDQDKLDEFQSHHRLHQSKYRRELIEELQEASKDA